MRQVLEAESLAQAQLVANLLSDNDIPAIVQGDVLSGAAGALPFWSNAGPGVWVVHDTDVEKALALLDREMQSLGPRKCPRCGYDLRATMEARCPECGGEYRPAPGHWICEKCGERLEGQFGECWRCGASRPNSSSDAG